MTVPRGCLGVLVSAALSMAAVSISVAQPGAPATGDPEDAALVTITLKDSQLVRGTILAETDRYIVLRLVSGGEMPIAHADIRDIVRNDESVYVSGSREVFKHDPNRSRYLYGPSALMLRQGEGYFSQTELLASTLGYGVTDWLTVQVGSVLPALLAGGDGANFIVGARIGTSLTEMVHVAGGFTSLVLPDAGAVGLAMVSGTLGTPRAHLTVSAGRPFVLDDDGSDSGDLFASLSANVRLSKHFGVVTENWLLRDREDTFRISSLAGRFMGEHMAVDVGFVFAEDGEFPLPWLDFTFNWR